MFGPSVGIGIGVGVGDVVTGGVVGVSDVDVFVYGDDVGTTGVVELTNSPLQKPLLHLL